MSARVPVLLLHGQPGTRHDWDRVLREIGDRLPTLAIERPGYDGLSEPGGIAHSGEHALRRLDELGIERTTIAGLSFGGGVAAWIAAHHPERVEAIVLVSPAANTDALVPADRVLAAPVAGPLASAALLALTGPHSRRALQAFIAEQRALFTELPDLEQNLHRIEAPATIVYGTRDNVVPPESSRRLARQIPGAKLVRIEGAHHTVWLSHARAVADAIVESTPTLAL